MKAQDSMTETDIRPIDVSYTAPDLPSPLISRPHLTDALIQIFDSGNEIVCVEGSTGYGKTTLLREFAQCASPPCFGVFLRAGSRHSYDPSLARADLADQINWYLESKRLSTAREPSDGELRLLITRCARALRRRNLCAYFIVDGLHHIPREDDSLLQAVLTLLPFGLRPYRFLFSSDAKKDIFSRHQHLQIKPFTLVAFASHETDEFLSGAVSDKTLRAKYHTSLGGIPLLLASTRRQIVSNPNPQHELTLQLPKNMNSFFEAEWSHLSPMSEETEAVLGYLLAYGGPVTADQLLQHVDLSESDLTALLSRLPVLCHSKNLGSWDFVSDSFRQFAATKLRSRVRESTEIIATKLLGNPDSDESLSFLPQFLQRTSNSNRILEWFDEKRFAAILLKTRTPAWTDPILRNTITICHDSKNDRALTTYSVLRSLVPQLSHTTGIDHEIRARCAMGDFAGAQSVCNSVPLLIQRLRLLAVLVDAASSSPGISTQPILDEIKELLTQVDLSSLQKDEAIDVATDLYPVDPESALQLVREAIQDKADTDSMEIAMARIAVAALQSKHSLDRSEPSDKATPKTTEVLVDELVRKFIVATRLSLSTRTGKEVLSKTAKYEVPAERLFVLRKWILQHSAEEDTLSVVEAAIQESISSANFSPTATFYREVLTPLPQIEDAEARSRLISVIDAQKLLIQRRGPTVDYVRLQLLLAHCNYLDGQHDLVSHRLEELYLETLDGIETLETRITSFAWCLAELHAFDPAGILDEHSQFRELVDEGFTQAVSLVIDAGADQFSILQPALEPLALHLPVRALAIAKSLNTADRRNEALSHMVEVVCEASAVDPDYDLLFEVLDEIDRGRLLDEAIAAVANRMGESIRKGSTINKHITGIFLRLDQCASASERSESLGTIAAALGEETQQKDLYSTIANRLRDDFAIIGIPRMRYTVGCKLVVLLHRTCPTLAGEIFGLFSVNNEVSRVGENVDQGCFFILDLLVKATSALAQADLLQDSDIRRMRKMITQVGDPLLRLSLYSTLAFFFWREQMQGQFATVVNEDIWPTLAGMDTEDKSSVYMAWTEAYAVVWLENRDRARAGVAEFPRKQADHCIWTLCLALLHKQPAGEPFDGNARRSKVVLTYPDIRNLIQLCEELEDDNLIYSVCKGIADQIAPRNSSARITRDQKAEIGRLITDIAERRLPIPTGVQHIGYQIVCKAQALRIAGGSREDWRTMVDSAKQLNNTADRAFVLAMLASFLPNTLRRLRPELLAEAEGLVDELTSAEDRYQRYSAIVDLGMDADKAMAVRVMRKAFRTVKTSSDNKNPARETQLVDLAYRVDSELPMQLALLYDDDPAREEYQQRARRQLARQDLKRELVDPGGDIVLRNRRNEPNLAAAAWQALGTLNAGRVVAVDIARIRDMIACASNYPLQTSYPMYSWVLSNVASKYASTPQATQYVRDMFEGLLKGAHFFFAITATGERLEFNPAWSERGTEKTHAVIGVGEREEGIKFLRDWMQRSLEDYVTIVDPYFGPEDLWAVRLVMEVNPQVVVRIVTRIPPQDGAEEAATSQTYGSAWRSICDQAPPQTEIIRVGLVQNSKTPFHDRWVLTEGTGIRLGTSLNSIGNKLSEISALGGEDLERVRFAVDGFLNRTVRELGGERLVYELFELAA